MLAILEIVEITSERTERRSSLIVDDRSMNKVERHTGGSRSIVLMTDVAFVNPCSSLLKNLLIHYLHSCLPVCFRNDDRDFVS